MRSKWLVRLFLAGSLSLTVLMLGPNQSPAQRVCCQGDWWLKWSHEARETYVLGYMLGYSKGHADVCQQGTEDLPIPSQDGIENEPLHRCSEKEIDFSKGSDYFVKAISDFYTQYPDDRDIYPYEVLEQLGKGLTNEEIHRHPFWRHHPPNNKP